MPKIMFMSSEDSDRVYRRSELEKYLIEEQGYKEERVKEMDVVQLLDLYEMYTEDC